MRAGAAGALAAGLLIFPASRALAQYSTSPGMAASPSGIVVVELANFHCNRCRAVNDHFDRLRAAARAAGHDLRFAPVAWDNQSLWPDRVYYATRDLFPAAEGLIRDAMFDGIQREGMIFETIPQVIAYLERRQVLEKALQLDPNFSLAAVAERAAAEDTVLAEAKAARLVNMSGAEQVPVFVWVKDGIIIKAVSPREAPQPIGLAQLVYRELTNQSSQPPP
jgi:hypothetical protein